MFKSALCSAASLEFGVKAGISKLMLKSPASIMFPVSSWENRDNEASNFYPDPEFRYLVVYKRCQSALFYAPT